MQLSPTPEQVELIRRLQEADLQPPELDRPGNGWRALGALGALGWPVSAGWNGSGHGPLTTSLLAEVLGHRLSQSSVLAWGAHAAAATKAVDVHGANEQKEEWLRDLATGERIACLAVTEPTSGGDISEITSTARQEGRDWLVEADKSYVTNGPIADVALILARTSQGTASRALTLFLVPLEGIETSSRPIQFVGLRGAAVGRLTIEGVVGEPIGPVGGGFSIFQEIISWERCLLFSALCGTAERVLSELIGDTRRSFSSRSAQAHSIASCSARLEACRWLVRVASSKLDRPASAALPAVMAKVQISELLRDLGLLAMQYRGASSFRAEAPVAGELLDSLGSTLYSGSNELLLSFIAGWHGFRGS